MVGEITQMKTFAEVIGHFAGKPASKKSFDDENGYSCLGFPYALYRDMGLNFPCTYGDLTLENYNEKYEVRSEEAYKKLLEFAETVGVGVEPHQKVAGDFLILKDKAGNIFPGIYAGNGQVTCCFEHTGIKTFSAEGKVTAIVVRRLR